MVPSTFTTDLLVIGSGTGMAAALAAHEQGLQSLVIEKTAYVGGSTARSGGAFWIPANPVLLASGSTDTLQDAETYLEAVVGQSAPAARWRAFLQQGSATVEMLQRMTPMRFFWARGYADYHPECPGGMVNGRTCECRPFDVARLGGERKRFRAGVLEAPIPMPITGADYKWLNLMTRVPRKAIPMMLKRMIQGVGGLLIGRHYVASGQALAAGLFAGLIRAGVPVWTNTTLVELILDRNQVRGAVVEGEGKRVTIIARRGVVLAAGGFDHQLAMRRQYQSPSLVQDLSLGAEGNTGDAITLAEAIGANISLMNESWWFPAVAPMGHGAPQVLLAERSLPGGFMVDGEGQRFINESTDYMSFGQRVLAREQASAPIGTMWLVFDQTYRNRYLLAGTVFPRSPLPASWYQAGIAFHADTPLELAHAAGLPEAPFMATFARFNELAASGVDADFHRGQSAYDRYYGDPTITPNPNLRPLQGRLYAVKVVLSDLGTCGGLSTDVHGQVLRQDGTTIAGLYAIGNTAANVFGRTYPGAGATIAQGLVFGYIAANHAASNPH